MTGKDDVIKRWIQKAEIDIKTARILIKSEDHQPNLFVSMPNKQLRNFLKHI